MRPYLILLFLIACAGENLQSDDYQLPDAEPLKVRTVTAKNKPVTRKIIGDGVVRAEREFRIHSRTAGFLAVRNVSSGQYVNKGDTLFRLEKEQHEIKYRLSEAEYFRKAYEYESMRLGYGDSARLSTDTVETALRLTSGMEYSRLQMIAAAMELESCYVLAPAAGIVVLSEFLPGAYISPDQMLARIYEPASVYLEAGLLETDLPLMDNNISGTAITLSGDSVRINYLSHEPWLNEKGIFRTIWRIDEPHRLIPGQHASLVATISLGTGIFLPRSAVVERGGKPVVFTLRDDTVRWNGVVTGWFSENQVEIFRGITPGDEVIISDQFMINEGVVAEKMKKK